MLSLKSSSSVVALGLALMAVGCGAVQEPRPSERQRSGSRGQQSAGDNGQRAAAEQTQQRGGGAPRAGEEGDAGPVAPAPGGSDARETGSREPPVPPLPEGTTILHVGDSFAGALGIDLNRELKKSGIHGVLHYQTSSYIPTWAWGKELDLYLLQSKPDLVLITLGANELEVPDPQQRVAAIEKLVHRVGDHPCVWIAPPLWEGARRALLDVIRAHCAPCAYMESSEVVPNLRRARDKIHPSMEARKTWARVVLEWLARHRDPNGAQPWALRSDDRSAGQANQAGQ